RRGPASCSLARLLHVLGDGPGQHEAARRHDAVGHHAGQHLLVGVGGGRRSVVGVAALVLGLGGVRHDLRELLDELLLEGQAGLVVVLVGLRSVADVGRQLRGVDGRQGGHRFTWLAICWTSSCVWRALLAIWNARWASIMSVMAVASSTLEPSSVPWVKMVD